MGLNLSFVQMYMYLITKKKEKQMNWNITVDIYCATDG